jgi:hypothetical protein
VFNCRTEYVAFALAVEHGLTYGLSVARSDPKHPCWLVGEPEQLRTLCGDGYRPAKPGETTGHPVFDNVRRIVGYAREVGL